MQFGDNNCQEFTVKPRIRRFSQLGLVLPSWDRTWPRAHLSSVTLHITGCGIKNNSLFSLLMKSDSDLLRLKANQGRTLLLLQQIPITFSAFFFGPFLPSLERAQYRRDWINDFGGQLVNQSQRMVLCFRIGQIWNDVKRKLGPSTMEDKVVHFWLRGNRCAACSRQRWTDFIFWFKFPLTDLLHLPWAYFNKKISKQLFNRMRLSGSNWAPLTEKTRFIAYERGPPEATL